MTEQTINSASPVAQRKMSKTKKALGCVCALTTAGFIGWMTYDGAPTRKGQDRQIRADAVGEIGNPFVPIPKTEALPSPPVVPAAARAPSIPMPTTGMQLPSLPAMPAVPRAPAPIAQFQASTTVATAPAQQAPATGMGSGVETISARSDGDRLNAKLDVGDDQNTAVATMLPDRNLFMTMGTPIACTTEQPIRTDVPGPFRCKVASPVYSTSGAVPLLDSGTWVVGRVSEGLERGSTRAFGVVTRLETPQGCLVKLRAPIGDQLGTPGIDGEIDTHFFERFRGVALLALLDTAGQATALAASQAIGNHTGISFNQFQQGSRQLGEGTVGNDLNIPSTLATHQARNIVVMAMQDIDMRSCFKLRAIK